MSIKELAEKVSSQFLTRLNKDRPFIIGIDGLSGAGKTTLVKELARELDNQKYNLTTFHLDDHIVEKNKRYLTGQEEWYEYYYLQWDIECLRINLFEQLHEDSEILSLSFYDKYTDHFSIKQIRLLTNSIVLIEGIFLQRAEWRSYFDFILYLDCPRELRYKRVLNRDSYIGDYQARLNKYKKRYWLGENHYLDKIDPIRKADIVIKG
ncbi:kinase [Rummeliibacillus stabekisii]|uniref:kinase n=1 Tax=Rummeliibacillus stabekisii TaxID=241244 RepID=UPI003717F804